MFLKWLTSSTVRQAVDMRKHVLKLVRAQQDLLTAEAIAEIKKSAEAIDEAIRSGASNEILLAKMKELDEVAVARLKPYPDATTRENVEVFLVAIAVAVAIRTFVLQPFTIPTGSMQPTLYGITTKDLLTESDGKIPGAFQRFTDKILHGTTYYSLDAQVDGRLTDVQLIKSRVPFMTRAVITIGGVPHTLRTSLDRFPLEYGHEYHKGDPVLRLSVHKGDYLFVDRLTYNFRRPKRGEIIVFATKGIYSLPQDQFYIKRLVGLPNEKLQIANDQHLVVNGRELTAAEPGFEQVYSFGEFKPELFNNQYFGHVNDTVGREFTPNSLAPLFLDENSVFQVRPRHYMAMGDNTLNSRDSRDWGDLPEENVIGRAYFVYWPFTSRFGWHTK